MKVGQLKKQLEQFPDDMDVFIDERTTEFTYGLLNTVTMQEIPFMEEPGGKVMGKDTVVILSEDI